MDQMIETQEVVTTHKNENSQQVFVDNQTVLHLRIVNIDYYLSEPNVDFDDIYSVFRQNQIKRVPVLRVFGVTENGLKTCLHIHRVYPYLSIKFDGKPDDNYEFQKQQFISELVNQLESHLVPNKVRTRNTTKESPNDQLIYDIQEVNAIPYYGFHDNYQKFLRIYFYNPSTLQKVTELLLSGQIMDRQIQPFEAHIPFTLQFLIDNNLYGMNYLDAKPVVYRKTHSSEANVNISGIEPMSSCQLECDIDFKDILNKKIDTTGVRLPGLEAIWTEQLKRCNNSQELLNLKGVASQERHDIPSTDLESYYMKRLFEGLENLKLKEESIETNELPQINSTVVTDETDFAQLMVQCIDSNDSTDEETTCDPISQTIEDVIINSKTLSINQTIEDVINSQNDIIIQTIEDVITESQKPSKTQTKHKRRQKTRLAINFNNLVKQSDETSNSTIDQVFNECTEDSQIESDSHSTVVYMDAGTQTELNDCFSESVDSIFGLAQEIDEIVCDCDSDECCDQCCDQGSDQCQCDCERCEYEKCKRIPQLDGAFDSDDSGSNFSPDYKDDADDSDFDVGSKRKRTHKKTSPKKTGTRSKSGGSSASKRKKSSITVASEDSDLEILEPKTSIRKSAARRRSSSVSPSKDVFESSSGRKVKSSKNLSDSLWEKFKPKADKKKTKEDSPTLHMSFSESEGSDKEKDKDMGLNFFNIKDFSYVPKKSVNKNDNHDNRSERSVTPYLSESEEELPPKTKPGPRSSKASETSRPGPKSSKAGPKSSKVMSKAGPKSSKSPPKTSKPGPKSSKSGPKSSKPGPKSSKKRDSISFSSDPENDSFSSTVGSRSRRNTKSVNYDDTIERTTSFFSEDTTPKRRGSVRSVKRKSDKSEVESAIDSISSYIERPAEEDDPILARNDFYDTEQYMSIPELSWKTFNGELVQIDDMFYKNTTLDTIEKGSLNIKITPEYIIRPYLIRYENHIEYWNELENQIKEEIKSGRRPTSGARSKGALKDFYTLPHLNVRRSPEKLEPVQKKKETVLKSPKKKNLNKSNEFSRLMSDACDIIDKPLSKRGATQTKSDKTKEPTTKRGSSAKSKQRSNRIQRGVTASTMFDAINIPFYESDIKVVTQLTGQKKKSYLKSLCDSFELTIDTLPEHYLNRYTKHNISPFLFENIYYNDYSGYLPDEQSQDTQDVLITLKNIINDVVSVSQSVDSLINEVCSHYEPKPMIDTQEEDYFNDVAAEEEPLHWDYSNFDDDQQIVDYGVPTFEDKFETNGFDYQKTPEIQISENGINDPLSEILLKTFGDNQQQQEEEEEVKENNDQSIEQINNNDESNGSENNELPITEQLGDQSDAKQSDDDYHSQQNYDCSEDNNHQILPTYDLSSEDYSPVPQTVQYSNASNGNYFESNSSEYHNKSVYQRQQPVEPEEEEEEPEAAETTDESNSCESNQNVDNPFSDDNIIYGFGVPQSNASHMSFQNPIQNPIVPTLIPHTSHGFQNSNMIVGNQQWNPCQQMMTEIPVQPHYSSMSTLNTTNSGQPESEFDISHFNYMNYYPNNPNIPQMDGIFDDEEIQTIAKPFNMRCSSDETIEQLSQGSRSEEASPKRDATEIVANAVREQALRTSAHKTRDNLNLGQRYGYYINGVVVKIDKSLPKQCLQQLGREYIPLGPLMATTELSPLSHNSDTTFSKSDSNLFFKTRLTGVAKFNYLLSLCNKNVRICLKRLNLNQIKSNINYKNNSFISVSSLLKCNKNEISDNSVDTNSRLSFQNNQTIETNHYKDNDSALTLNHCLPQSNCAFDIQEIPESPVNQTSKCDDMSDEIYSFYSDNTLSPNLSQSTQMSNVSVDEIPETDSSDFCNKQQSTPINSPKFKPISQTLTESQKALNLSVKESNNSSFNHFSQFSFESNGLQPIISDNNHNNNKFNRNESLIEGPTPSTTLDYEFSSYSDFNDNSLDSDYQYLTTMSTEIHVSTRAKLNPEPKIDAIEVIFYSVCCDRPSNQSGSGPEQNRQPIKYITGLIVVESDVQTFDCNSSFNIIEKRFRPRLHSVCNIKGIAIDFVDDEIVLLTKFVEIVKQYDPDFIVGYKVDSLSWGYILERANILNMSILTPLSRINDEKFCRNDNKCQLTGRITLNLWSIMRSELTLNQYSYENCHFHILHERIPNFSFEKLTQLYANRFNPLNRRRVIDYYLRRTVGSLRLLDKTDFIGRTSELSRLFGIQFHEVFNRGTQFRVESIMLRLTRLMDYIPISPSHRQVSTQRAPEILPLILEPESKYYTDPIVVLDFQSLYPSMMIAYNYCYSTCLGRVDQLIRDTDFVDLGCFELEINKQLVFKYKNDIHISPNGVVFLKSNIRKGVLSRMLEQILDTRVMVKKAIKINNKKQFPNKGLNRKLEARQLGLKLIANVTYGYTSANFSGRMPCVEIADSIVAKGRETLERAINLVHSRPEWGAKVVYGDTDSLFVHFPGLTKEDAFRRGQEIAEVVTQQNPKPVRLKLEKVYTSCVLETKKRYVGFSYESPEQTDPIFDAKGIETVRRDTCPAVAKMLEKSLRILFSTNDLNGVKNYLQRQFQKILNGRISILEDFVFAREYRGAESYSSKSHVPSAEIAKRRLAVDPRNEPKAKERVPYVVIAGPPNEQLFKLVKEPLDLINDPSLRLNSQYYIEKAIIPALNRVFTLMGQNVNNWYREMPKKVQYQRYQYLLGQNNKTDRKIIPQFFNTSECCVCRTNCKSSDFCDSCRQNKDVAINSVSDQIRDLQLKYSSVFNSCKQCSASTDTDIGCQSIECPNLYRYHQSRLDLMNANYLTKILNNYF